jgi:hypothetical protein
MKLSLLAIFSFATLVNFAQTSVPRRTTMYVKNDTQFYFTVVSERITNDEEEDVDPRISVVSKNRDTLWLVDQPIGHLIASTWDTNPLPDVKKPVIIFVKDLPPATPQPESFSDANGKVATRKSKKGKRIRTE